MPKRSYGENEEPQALEIPEELASWLDRYKSIGRMIDSAQDAYRRGDEMLDAVDKTPHLRFRKLPKPWLFVLVPVADRLHIEVRQSDRPLDPVQWRPVEDSDDIAPHVSWTRAHPRRPVFIGNLLEIDYKTPEMTRWIYSEKKRSRAAHHKGIDLLPRTTDQIERLYTH